MHTYIYIYTYKFSYMYTYVHVHFYIYIYMIQALYSIFYGLIRCGREAPRESQEMWTLVPGAGIQLWGRKEHRSPTNPGSPQNPVN